MHSWDTPNRAQQNQAPLTRNYMLPFSLSQYSSGMSTPRSSCGPCAPTTLESTPWPGTLAPTSSPPPPSRATFTTTTSASPGSTSVRSTVGLGTSVVSGGLPVVDSWPAEEMVTWCVCGTLTPGIPGPPLHMYSGNTLLLSKSVSISFSFSQPV
jgi:hypothetical protein